MTQEGPSTVRINYESLVDFKTVKVGYIDVTVDVDSSTVLVARSRGTEMKGESVVLTMVGEGVRQFGEKAKPAKPKAQAARAAAAPTVTVAKKDAPPRNPVASAYPDAKVPEASAVIEFNDEITEEDEVEAAGQVEASDEDGPRGGKSKPRKRKR